MNTQRQPQRRHSGPPLINSLQLSLSSTQPFPAHQNTHTHVLPHRGDQRWSSVRSWDDKVTLEM